MIYPNTSLGTYPLFHYISVQSFFLHGTMVYLGMLVNITNYIEIELKDIKYYFILVMTVGIAAWIVNSLFGSNLMFISQNFPNTPVEYIYNHTGTMFSIVMILMHAIIPFYMVYFIKMLLNKKELKDRCI